ncbi:hypothetical protein F5Y12DRAFT_799098 [Xylaria sp. FL1777]|nr:hypothetical protein F5Y12DRAFT_799098 [Xylaria sp. FL1777]
MATEQPSIPGISSRRSACDKCRFAKSRCLRSHSEQPKCDRCTRANCECTTSPIFRVRDWRPGDGNDYVSRRQTPRNEDSRRRRRGGGRQSISVTTIIPPLTNLHSSADNENYSSSRVPSCPVSDRYSKPAPTELSSISQEDTDTYAEAVFDHMEGNTEGTDIGFALPDDFFATRPILESDNNIAQSLPVISPSSIKLSGGVTSLFGDDTISQDQNFQDCGLSNTDPCLGTEQTPIQRLSQLDYKLIALRVKVEQAVPEVIMQTLFEGTGKGDSPCSLVMNEVLGKTTDLVDILSSLSKSYAPETEPLSYGPTHSSNNGSRRRRSTSLSTCPAYDSDAAASTGQGTDTQQQLTIPSTSECAHVELDTPALLLILATYSRLLGIYLIMFAHIYKYLRAISESDNPHLRPVSGLSIGNYSAHSGNLQILILIQIITSDFEKIEVLLGLPVEFRISRRRGERDGLFGAYGFLDLATAILRREEDGTSGRGKGGIKTLRRNIARAKSLLKERIAP